MWVEIAYLFPTFNGAAREWISSHTYLSMLGSKSIHVNKRGTRRRKAQSIKWQGNDPVLPKYSDLSIKGFEFELNPPNRRWWLWWRSPICNTIQRISHKHANIEIRVFGKKSWRIYDLSNGKDAMNEQTSRNLRNYKAMYMHNFFIIAYLIFIQHVV